MKVHANVILQLIKSGQGNQMLLRSQSKELRTCYLQQWLLKIFLLELRVSAACYILFEIHIALGIVYFQNIDKVDYKLVFHTLYSNQIVYLLVCDYFCHSFLSFDELGQYRHDLIQKETQELFKEISLGDVVFCQHRLNVSGFFNLDLFMMALRSSFVMKGASLAQMYFFFIETRQLNILTIVHLYLYMPKLSTLEVALTISYMNLALSKFF